MPAIKLVASWLFSSKLYRVTDIEMYMETHLRLETHTERLNRYTGYVVKQVN